MEVLSVPAKVGDMAKSVRDSVDPAILEAALRRAPVEPPDGQRRDVAGISAEQLAAIDSARKAGLFVDFAPKKQPTE